MIRHPRAARPLVALALLALAAPAVAAEVPSPEAHLGYRPGADFHLADWATVVDYFRKVDAASDRVQVRELGRTTEDRPYIVATVSSPETMGRLGFYQLLQAHLADPRKVLATNEKVDPVADSKPVVLITCSIHSSETASTLMAMELLHELASKDDVATREVLDRTILLLVPSANPDGVEKVARWYERTRGRPWEGEGMPELYHAYAGHDTNRDWFMLNLEETRLLTRLLYREWFPTLTYDVHQMGRTGARLFVPPFYDPINPNLDPRLHQGIALIGAHMAFDLTAAGKKGVLTHAMYDNWWNGGNRTTPQRHNMVGVLTEAASVRMASPVFLDAGQLRGGARGFADHKPAANFVDPWPGGWWRLRDIVEYELVCARSLLTLAARRAAAWQGNYRAMAQAAIDRGRDEPPFAWVVPSGGRDPGTAATMVRTLHETGVEVYRAPAAFRAGGASYPAGSWILPAAQPYRAHLKDMMERQQYPARFTAGGNAEPPYDVAGWTLPLQMGVRSVTIAEPFDLPPGPPLERVEPARGSIAGPGAPGFYLIRNEANDDLLVLNALLAAGVEVEVHTAPARLDDTQYPAGVFRFAADEKARAVLDEVLPRAATQVVGVAHDQGFVGPLPPDDVGSVRVRPQRIGVYQPWVPSMDEGWTRLVLERFGFPYATLHNADVRAGDLRERFDAILIPSIPGRVLREGYAPNETDPAFVGGLGQDGADALRDFVEDGGTLVCLEDSGPYAIAALDLPVKEVLGGLKSSEFYGPGSIVRTTVATGRARLPGYDPLTFGVPEEVSAYFDRSLAFEANEDVQTWVPVRYARANVLESGWLLGAKTLEGKAAVVAVHRGRGRVVLFGFPPQHRGQPHGTFRLLFNALLLGGMTPAS